jgi:hypothetical protein
VQQTVFAIAEADAGWLDADSNASSSETSSNRSIGIRESGGAGRASLSSVLEPPPAHWAQPGMYGSRPRYSGVPGLSERPAGALWSARATRRWSSLAVGLNPIFPGLPGGAVSPARTAAAHWAAPVAPAATVQRIWRAHQLQPHRLHTLKRSRAPGFAAKLADIIGFYVDPSAHAVVLLLEDKSQIQALDRIQPGLSIKTGRCQTMTHDYKRHGTTTVFAAPA